MANVSSSNGIEKCPKLRFPNFNEPYNLTEFSKFAEVNPKCEKVPNSFYYIDLECVNDGEIKDLRIEMADTAPSRAQRLLSLHDILFQTVRPYQKNNYHFKAENDLPTVASTGYAVFRTHQNSEYLYELIHTERFLSDIMKRCTGTSFPAVSSSDIEDIAIWIPEFQEQQKIGEFLTLVDTKIAKQRLLIEHLKKYKRGFIEMFFNEITLRQNDGYQVVSLGEIADLRGRIGFRGYTRSDIVNKGEGVVSFSPSNIMNGFVDFEECTYISESKYIESPEIMVNQHDILFTKTGSTIGKIGYVKELKERATINPQIALITAHSCEPYYLFLAMSRKAASNYVRSISVGGAIPTLSQEQLKQLSIPLITIKKQRELSSFILKLDNRIDCQIRTLTQLNKLKSGLMQQLFV